MFSAIDQSGKMPSFCRSPATSATGAATSAPSARPKTWIRSSVWPWPLRPPRPMTSPAWATSSPASAAAARAGAHHRRGIGRGAAARSRRPRGATLPMARTSDGAVEGGGAVERHDPGVAHDGDAVGGREDFAEQVGDQDHAAAGRGEAADVGEQLAGEHAVERRRGLVEDHHLGWRVGLGEGAGDLDHLPAGDREAADLRARVDAVAGEDLVEHAAHQRRGAAAPAEAGERGA